MTDSSKEEKFAIALVNDCTLEERNNLSEWIEQLLLIKNSELSKLQKSKKALKVTLSKESIFPLIKLIYKFFKKHVWDNRDKKSRLGIFGIGVGMTFFAGQGAGIAALGGAIGVPLWIIFGAGATFAGFILEEIDRKKSEKPVIDAEYSEVQK